MFEFAHTLTSLDGVPAEFAGLYKAVEGGSGFSIHPDLKTHVGGLVSALDKERKLNKTAKDGLLAWSALGETPDAVKTKLDELTESAAGKANFDKLKLDMELAHGKLLSAKDAEVGKMRGTLEQYLVDAEATTALSEAKGAAALLLPHVRASVKVMEENGKYVVRIVDKDGDARGDGKGGFMTIKDLVSEMRHSETFGRAFEATGATGGGKPSAGGKPGARETDRSKMSSIQKIAAGLTQRATS